MNSPRSLQACLQLGIEQSELFYVDMNKFLNYHPELRNASQNIKQYRYDHFEKLRQNSIDKVRAERQKIIDSQDNNNNSNQFQQKTSPDKVHRNSKSVLHSQSASNLSINHINNISTYSVMDNRMEKMLQEEKKNIEKIKIRQKIEIQSLIETQIKAEMLKKNAEEKEKRMKEK